MFRTTIHEETVPYRPNTYLSRKSALLLFVPIIGLSLHGVALSDDFCSEPVAPYCVDKDSDFQSKVEVDRCEKDLSDYDKELSEYEKCVKSQIEDLRKGLSAAKKRLEDAKQRL